MAILSILPKKQALQHTANITGRSYTVDLIAVVNDLSTGPITIRGQLATWGFLAGQPFQWPLPPATAVEQDLAARLVQIDVNQDSNDGLNYTITLHYQTKDPEQEGAQGEGLVSWVMAPWLAYPSLKWSSEDSEFYPTHDRTGKPILNSAGDIFDPSPSIPLPTPIATITRVEQGFLPIWITQFKGTVNAAPWMGFPAESVLCKDITADSSTDSDWGILYNVTYTFAFRPPILASDGVTIMVAGWDAFIANVGKRQLVDGKREEIRDKDGQSISDPVPLQLVDGTYDEDDPKTYYLRFPVYPTSDFSYFNFPANLFSYVP